MTHVPSSARSEQQRAASALVCSSLMVRTDANAPDLLRSTHVTPAGLPWLKSPAPASQNGDHLLCQVRKNSFGRKHLWLVESGTLASGIVVAVGQ